MLVSEILLKYDTDKNLGHQDHSLGHCYGKSYDKIFEPFDGLEHITLLEIGIQKGGSLCAWNDFFKNGKIIGVDIVDSVIPSYRKPNIEYIISDIKNEQTLKKLSLENYDIIIDDGSHYLDDVLFALSSLSKCLNPNGVYIIEDCQQPETWLQNIKNVLNQEFEISFEDFRGISGRYDDFLIIVKKLK